ncbi:MAG: VPLPA-CTERM sorting domain-containing protein, partial [Candidatus Thiodiazotropha taylori]|nr:VPLPA-CTERM sorting domain-containing protein [Candidatus Thiodiazotropha taylori]MCW4325768.1 VPLPA-CTERM sorting domain-containing protein [Candidatus Thiodiazotropha taylori]
ASSVAPVPVPAAVWLFGTGLAGIVTVSRRGRKSKSAA